MLDDALRAQAGWCRRLGSPLYAGLLERAVGDAAVRAAVAGHETDPPGSMLAMRLMGAVNRLAVEGDEPALAHAFGAGDPERAWPVFRDVLVRRRAAVNAGLRRPVQTNEVLRCAALAGGFLAVARAAGLPLALLELGSSAGLNLRWDRYRYGFGWGPEDSPVRIEGVWERPPPATPAHVPVADRRGCDPSPVDPTTAEGQHTLLAYVWPDMEERVALLRAALAVAEAVPAPVERSSAAPFLERELAAPREGAATVVFHSIVWQYLPHAERDRVVALLDAAGARASARAPLAWLRLEPGGEQAQVRLTTWPGGEQRVLADATFHGRAVRWRDG